MHRVDDAEGGVGTTASPGYGHLGAGRVAKADLEEYQPIHNSIHRTRQLIQMKPNFG